MADDYAANSSNKWGFMNRGLTNPNRARLLGPGVADVNIAVTPIVLLLSLIAQVSIRSLRTDCALHLPIIRIWTATGCVAFKKKSVICASIAHVRREFNDDIFSHGIIDLSLRDRLCRTEV